MEKLTICLLFVVIASIVLVIYIDEAQLGFGQNLISATNSTSGNGNATTNDSMTKNVDSMQMQTVESNNSQSLIGNDTLYKDYQIPLTVYTFTIEDVKMPFLNETSGSYKKVLDPKNGNLTGLYPNFKYISKPNFEGQDKFVINKINSSNATDILESATFQVDVNQRNPPGSTVINPTTYREHEIPVNVYTDTITDITLPFNETVFGSHAVIELPKNGKLTVKNPQNPLSEHPRFMYQSKVNFSGADKFTIQKRDLDNSTNLLEKATFQVDVNQRNPNIPLFWDDDPISRSIVALTISALITTTIFILFWAIVRRFKTKKYKGKVFKIYFSDIIRTSDWDPSLSIFQFLSWTAIILFSFLGLYLVRIFSGVTDFVPGGIPTNVLGLMGISVAVPLISQYITKSKKGPGTLTDQPPPDPRPPLSVMLQENNQPSLSRFQLFAWTWISIIVYMSVLFSQINTHMDTSHNLLLPDIDPTLLLLMGLSNFVFLGVKAQNSKMQITSIFPEQELDVTDGNIQALKDRMILPTSGKINIGKQHMGETISIFGTNFARQRDKIWFDDTPFPVEGSDIKNEITWQPTGDRIDVRIPDNLLPPVSRNAEGTADLYLIRVANNGFLSEPFILRVLPKRG
jgi:hypothetical protein